MVLHQFPVVEVVQFLRRCATFHSLISELLNCPNLVNSYRLRTLAVVSAASASLVSSDNVGFRFLGR